MVAAEADDADPGVLMVVLRARPRAHDRPILAPLLLLDRERVDAAHPVPAVVLAALRGGGLEVDFLPDVLTDVGDVEVARLPVEGEGPRVADAVGPDLGLRALLDLREVQLALAEKHHELGIGRADKRVRRGYLVGTAAIAHI